MLKASDLSFLLPTDQTSGTLTKVDCIRVVQLCVNNMIEICGSNHPDIKLQNKYTMALESIFPQRSDDCNLKKMITNRLRNTRTRKKIRNAKQIDGRKSVSSVQSSTRSDAGYQIDVEEFISAQTILLEKDNGDTDDDIVISE